MAIALAGAIKALLSGAELKWPGFGGYAGGSIRLATAGARRVFDFLLQQDALQVVAGSEGLFPGLIAAWKDETRDPAQSVPVAAAGQITGPWRLQRIEAANFGGLTRLGGEVFDMNVGAENWCLEGQNGSGKTALINSILWALTGLRVREHVGPIQDRGERSPVLDDAGAEIGTWPPLSAYPASRDDLRGDAEVWVRLTFVNPDGETAQAFRKATSPRGGLPAVEEKVDARLRGTAEFMEGGLLMPARLTQMSFGEDSHSLYEAVKRLTGLDQLAYIAKGVADQFAHYGRTFLKYAKAHGLDDKVQAFDESIREAVEKSAHLGLDLSPVASIEAADLDTNLQGLITTCSSEAARQLGILKAEISADVDVAKAGDRESIRDAVATAKVLLEEKADHIPVFAAWTALTEAAKNQQFAGLVDALADVERKLEEALRWHRKQLEDRKLRLKALAAEWFKTGADPTCPLCEGPLTTPEQRALAQEMGELKRVAAVAERRLGEVCDGLENQLRRLLPDKVSGRLALFQTMEPRAAYVEAVAERFVERKPFTDILTGFAGCMRDVLATQERSLPRFEFTVQEQHAEPNEPTEVAGLRRFVNEMRRLVELARWWSEHRAAFVQALADLRGKVTPGAEPPERSMRGQIRRLEEALSKAEPYEVVANRMGEARRAAKAYGEIRAEQKVREDIREAMLPLKDLRLLVEADTARSISELSGQIEAILNRIHLRERLAYRNTKLQKKEVRVHGAFTDGMKIDATLVANTSWLRAILWAFILALREETVRRLGANSLPLLLLDDPQTTFDPRNKLKWGEELARIANRAVTDPTGAQLFVTTHDHEFFIWLTEREKVGGQHGLIAPVEEESGAATIISGGCLRRLWDAAEGSNDDRKARDYIMHVRIHAEKLLKIMMRGEGPHIQKGTFESLRNELQQLAANHVRPYDGKVVADLLKCMQKGEKAVALISDVHHSDAETLGFAQAKDVHEFWETRLERRILDALKACLEFASFHGDSRTFAHEPCVVTFPARQREELRRVTLIETGIAAAAKTDGRAGDGLLMIEEWEVARLRQVKLPNHELYRMTAGTLEPVATIGDMVIVSNYAKVGAPALVVAAVGDRLLARRYNEMEAHADIAVLTGQAINPYNLVEPVMAVREELQARKVVGTLFASKVGKAARANGRDELVGVDDVAEYWAQLNGARLFRVAGRSAEPIALDGQFLMTREAVPLERAIQSLDGELVVAVDDEGTRYFKRLRRARGSLVILESLNPDGMTAAEVLTLDAAEDLPRLMQVLPVVGVLFELPADT